MVFVPITHHLVHAATVHAARQAAHLLDEVLKERGAWPEFVVVVVDVAVQRLVHSKYDLRHRDFPPVSGDAELPALPVTGRRELLGRQILGQIRRLVERADLDPARA